MSYSPIQHGDSTHVKVFGDNLSVVAEIHSHPNNTPPSHDDIMSVARFGGKANSMYEGLYVYTNDRIYGLIVTDRQKASAFYNQYGDKAVGENNLFVEKTLDAKINQLIIERPMYLLVSCVQTLDTHKCIMV